MRPVTMVGDEASLTGTEEQRALPGKNETVVVGMVDTEEPSATVDLTWEVVDMECA